MEFRIVKKLLWLPWLKIWGEVNWYDLIRFSYNDKLKSISRFHSFHAHYIKDPESAWIHLMSNFNPAYDEMIWHWLGCKYIRLRLRDKDFNSYSRPINLHAPTNDKTFILKVIREQFDEAMKSKALWRITGVVLWELKDMKYE